MKRLIPLCLALLVVLFIVAPVHAYLGGFEQADGYVFASTGYYNPPAFDNWVDVVDYNAGQWGPNAGGGPLPVEIPVNSGLWSYNSQAGSFYATQALRATWMGPAPLYSATTPAAQAASVATYVIGNHFNGRFGTTALAMRDAVSAGPLSYDYKLDSFDYGGTTPSTVTSGTVKTNFYFQPNPPDNITAVVQNSNGTVSIVSPEKFYMSFTDSTGNIGFQWGYAHDNTVIWRAGSTGSWNYTSIVADCTNYIGNNPNNNYDGVTAYLNLSTQTFQLDYFDVSANLTTTIAAAGTSLGATMIDQTHLGWWLDDNLTSGIGGKNFFDDFSFNVPTSSPEPASLAVLGLGGLALIARRRRHG